ncbi:NAD(P)-binding protein [Ascobolus immersus RN42]|uniref:NAD(P)-binding protein n=1 Tax=Ascobolus immersus RN42 TaxID=1160509 RepID=A0A3N4I065_ASCIM|nr:NAD(P)-binding protein [Ascobolus immersus RN42]
MSNTTAVPRTLPVFSLTGKTALVTGAARGLGREFLLALVASGARGICADLSLPSCNDSIAAIRTELLTNPTLSTTVPFAADGSDIPDMHGIAVDVTDEESVKACFKEAVEKFGSVDILVTAAGICQNIPAEEYSYADWKKVMSVNLDGTFLCAREAGRYMIAAAKAKVAADPVQPTPETGTAPLVVPKTTGSIIMISSMSARIVNRPQPQCAYNASKAGVSHLCKSLASEWAQYGIRVNALCPGYQMTELLKGVMEREGPELANGWMAGTPMGRLGVPRELRGAVVFLGGEASSFMTGQEMVVDGGYEVW